MRVTPYFRKTLRVKYRPIEFYTDTEFDSKACFSNLFLKILSGLQLVEKIRYCIIVYLYITPPITGLQGQDPDPCSFLTSLNLLANCLK